MQVTLYPLPLRKQAPHTQNIAADLKDLIRPTSFPCQTLVVYTTNMAWHAHRHRPIHVTKFWVVTSLMEIAQ